MEKIIKSIQIDMINGAVYKEVSRKKIFYFAFIDNMFVYSITEDFEDYLLFNGFDNECKNWIKLK